MELSRKKQEKLAKLEAKRAARQSKEKAPEPFKYLITLAYDGSGYGGYAKQKHKNTIQDTLEGVLKQYFNQEIKTTEASRTDSKVHALNQKVTFLLSKEIAVDKVKTQLNELLPRDIVIKYLEQVSSNFHCRHHVVDKTYEYTIGLGEVDPRKIRYAWFIGMDLDVEKMREASQCLIGEHDFSTFKSAKATTDTSIRTINFLEIEEKESRVIVRINGNGFLYNMVRLIVKALTDVGSSREEIGYVKELLDSKAKPDNLESAPAQGLCLMEINYK